jgi:hypothetical protein
MTGTKTSYSLSRAIYTTGAQTYKVGIYNAKNALQGKVSSGNYTVSSSTNNPPTLTLMSGDESVEQNKVYTLQLKATDIDNNLRSITVDWKDGSKAETQTATNDATLTFTHTYVTAGKFELTATAKDSGIQNLTSTILSKTISVVVPPVGSYSKVCNSGALEREEDCPINPMLGTKSTDWACTKDNNTGLIWEIKTDDSELRDNHWSYTWYDGSHGYREKYNFNCKYSDCNTYSFINAVNAQGLCGANDWRMPTKDELLGISIKRDSSGDLTVIDETYFPDKPSTEFLTSSGSSVDYRRWRYMSISSILMDTSFYDSVRLVRNAQ